MQRLSLTARLTAYFSLSSAAVLLGLGILIALAMEEHFAVEDFTALGENVNVIRRVVESSSATEVSTRLNDVLQHPFTPQASFAEYEAAPLAEEVVHATFCGT